MTLLRENTTVSYLPVDKIAANPYQPRKFFDRPQMEELINSIQEYGVMQPITVRSIGSNYELVSGERRLRASRLAGFDFIPAIIVSITDKDSAILALIENLQRHDLNYLEEAEGYANLISDYRFTQEDLARKLGKNQSTVANKLRLLRLPRSVKNGLMSAGLSERHARALLRLELSKSNESTIAPHNWNSEQAQLDVLATVVSKQLNVKKTEALVEQTIHRSLLKPKAQRKIRTYIRDVRLFTNTIKHAVETMKNGGVDTIYDIEENKDGCFISIMVKYT